MFCEFTKQLTLKFYPMKKILFALLLMSPVLFSTSCEKEKQLEEKMEGQSGATEDGYGLNEHELAQVNAIKNEIFVEINKGDSIAITLLRQEIDSLRQEIKYLKGKK
jgi:hypothetical protein